MRYRKLGATGMEVSEVGFGAWAIGGEDYGPTDDQESLAALERAYDLGVNFFDTSDMYGAGHSESLVGRALKGKNPPAIVATKAGFVGRRGSHGKDFSRSHIHSAAEESLRRLQRETIDLYQLHNPALSDLGDGELFGIMDELVAAGKVRYWGVSIGTKDTAEIARRAMAWPSAASIQIICNLFHRSVLEDLRDGIRAGKIGVVARAPLEYGLLTGKFSLQTRFPPSDQRSWRWTPDEFSRRLGQVERLRAHLGSGRLSPAQVAIGFVLSYSEISVVICGAKRPSQVEENAATSDLWAEALTEDELRSLRTVISP